MHHTRFHSLRGSGPLLGLCALMSGLAPTVAAAGHADAGDGVDYARGARMRHLLHWSRMPVTVAFAPGPALTPERQRQVRAGFDEWVRATDGVIRYTLAASPAQADITVTLDSEAGIVGSQGTVGSTSMSYAHDRMRSAQIEIATGRATAAQIQEVAAHEFGHALGIDGHSDDPEDLMAASEVRVFDAYGSPMDTPARAVTRRDLGTLRACYSTLFTAPPVPESVVKDDPDSETVTPAAPPR